MPTPVYETKVACIIRGRLARVHGNGRRLASSSSVSDKPQQAVVSDKPQETSVSTQTRETRTIPWRPRNFLSELFSPFRQTPSLTHMMNAVDKIFDSMVSAPLARLGLGNFRIPWDVMEDDKCFKLRLDIPGARKEDIKVTVGNGDLVVQTEQKDVKTDNEWASRSYAEYYMRIRLPENVDKGAIKAELKDGVLHIMAPKVEGKTAEEIEVQVS